MRGRFTENALVLQYWLDTTFSLLNQYKYTLQHTQPLPLWQKAAAGLTAGGLGALVGSPADLTLIRMQADSTLPPDQRRNYKGVVDAMVRTVKEDGVVGLFRGGGPTVVRAMALNMGMLASNDQVWLCRVAARPRCRRWPMCGFFTPILVATHTGIDGYTLSSSSDHVQFVTYVDNLSPMLRTQHIPLYSLAHK